MIPQFFQRLIHIILPEAVIEGVTSGEPASLTIAAVYTALTVISILALAVVVERSVRLRMQRWVYPSAEREIESAVQDGAIDKALALCRKCRTIPAQLLGSELDAHRRGLAPIEESVETTEELSALSMRANLDLLATMAKLAPLLGLLGTVLGMMMAFDQLDANARKETLAQGITAALDTTVRGLIVAIFCLAFERVFLRRIQRIALRVDHFLRSVLRAGRSDRPNHDENCAEELPSSSSPPVTS